MEDTYRHRNDTNKRKHVQAVEVFFVECVLMRGGGFLTRRLRGKCCTQSTDVQASVTRFCVQLLLKRGAATPSSLNTTKNKKTTYKIMFTELFLLVGLQL